MEIDTLLECDQQEYLHSRAASDEPVPIHRHHMITSTDVHELDIECQPGSSILYQFVTKIYLLSFAFAEYWLESDNDVIADIEPPLLDDELTSNSEQNKSSPSIVWWIMLFVNVFQTLHFTSDHGY